VTCAFAPEHTANPLNMNEVIAKRLIDNYGDQAP
jgi:hypothetical protein